VTNTLRLDHYTNHTSLMCVWCSACVSLCVRFVNIIQRAPLGSMKHTVDLSRWGEGGEVLGGGNGAARERGEVMLCCAVLC